MPAKDIYHHAVECALIKDGWVILAEDYALTYGSDRVYADIAAKKAIAAERNSQKIIVEVKSFIGRSFIHELEQAIGQYTVYRDILEETSRDFEPYLAITKGIWKSSFQRKLPQMLIRRNQVRLLIVDPDNEVVEQWIS